MTWYIKLGGRVVGWVIAAHREEALVASMAKFPGWGIEEDREVVRRRR